MYSFHSKLYFLWCVCLNTYEERTSPLFISSVNYRFVSTKKNEQQDSLTPRTDLEMQYAPN